MSSDTGFELDRELAFRYALVPHTGDWRQAKVYRHGLELNHPLMVRKSSSHEGALPKRWGLLDVSHPNCVVSALKLGTEGTTILRVYETTGEAAPGVNIRFDAQIDAAHEVNLMEDLGEELAARDRTLSFDLAPFEIKTFRLQLREGTLNREETR